MKSDEVEQQPSKINSNSSPDFEIFKSYSIPYHPPQFLILSSFISSLVCNRHILEAMLGLLFLLATGILLVSYLILYPTVEYYYDPKGLRKFPNLNALSGLTNLSFVYEARKGIRSEKLLELHKKFPVIRIGPNSLSFGEPRAIKACFH